MTLSKNINKIYNDIIKNKVIRSVGINHLISLLKETPNRNIKFEIIEILNKLTIEKEDIVEILIDFLNSDENQFIKLTIAKLLIQNHAIKCFTLLKTHINSESSAFFITSLFKFLNTRDLEIDENLKDIILKKYSKIYNIGFKEERFFLDLETTQIESSNHIDFKIGYFSRFKADNIEILQNDNYYNFMIKDFHVIALDLSRWEIKELPKSIGILSKLRYLSLANLELNYLPETINLLSHLKYLNLGGNKFRNIPQWLLDFIDGIFSQKYIDEGVEPIEAVALSLIEVLKGSKLEKVNIESDLIHWESALNYKINNDGNIIGLYIDDEKSGLGILPEILCTLKHLQELILPNSSIENIPNCIGGLQALKYLDLSFNKIRSIPESINNLRRLEYLNLNENDIPDIKILSLRWYKSGESYLNKEEYDKAIVECKKTLEVYPRNKFAWFHLGIAYKEKDEYSQAERVIKKFLEIDPQNTIALDYLSDIYQRKGEYINAIATIKHAIDIIPDVALLWSNLGFNFKKIGKYNEAIDAYLHSIEINPNSKNVWKDLASIYRDKGDYMKAIEADERALEIEFNLNK